MARVARLSFIPPQLPSLTDQPPERADWIHEVKHEGYRTMLLVERGRLRPYPQWAQLERPIPRHYCSGTQAFVPVGIVQFSSAKSSLAMLPHSFAPVPHMSLRGEARKDFEARLGKLKQVSFGWRLLCTAKTLGFHFCRSELTRFAFSRLPSAYSINSWLT